MITQWNDMVTCPHCKWLIKVLVTVHTDFIILTQCEGQEKEHDWLRHDSVSHWRTKEDALEVR